MKAMNDHIDHENGIIRDAVILIFLFLISSFVDLQLAFLVSVICFYLLMIRRVILKLNPGFIRGYRIIFKGKELVVPKGVDVFTIDDAHSIQALDKYAEIIQGIAAPPGVIIVRFSKIKRLTQLEANILLEFMDQASAYKMTIIFSDVGAILHYKFRKSKIELKIGEDHIFCYISDALVHARKILNANFSDPGHLFNPYFFLVHILLASVPLPT